MSTTAGEGTQAPAKAKRQQYEYVVLVQRTSVEYEKIATSFTAFDVDGALEQGYQWLVSNEKEVGPLVAVLAKRFKAKAPKVETTTKITF